MTTIEQLETLRNAELYEDCKTLVIFQIYPIQNEYLSSR